eukprot:2492443-Karenia_brevis.AAC.1
MHVSTSAADGSNGSPAQPVAGKPVAPNSIQIFSSFENSHAVGRETGNTIEPCTQSAEEDDSDATLSVSYDSEFEKLEDELMKKVRQHNDHDKFKAAAILRNRYWDARNAAKRSSGSAKVANQPSQGSPDPPPVPRIHKAVELFCGSARMASALQKVGFEALGIDYRKNKDKPSSRYLELDLATEQGQSAARAIVNDPQVAAVWMGPPCGTASRARQIRR